MFHEVADPLDSIRVVRVHFPLDVIHEDNRDHNVDSGRIVLAVLVSQSLKLRRQLWERGDELALERRCDCSKLWASPPSKQVFESHFRGPLCDDFGRRIVVEILGGKLLQRTCEQRSPFPRLDLRRQRVQLDQRG